jgi:cupin
MFEYASSELAVGQPGSDTVLAKLSEVLFVEAVRRHTQQLPAGETGWLAGLRDQPVARAGADAREHLPQLGRRSACS